MTAQTSEPLPDVVEPEVLLDVADGVATITINRPRRKNAMTTASWELLGEVVEAVRVDPEVRAVVLCGTGGDLCAGSDLGGPPDPRHALTRMRALGDIAATLYELPKPVVARIDGVAVGAGCNLALGCDLVVATPRSRFSQIFARRGLSVDFGGTWLLPRIVGIQQAKRLALTGEIIEGPEAERLGLVTWLKEPDEIDEFVDELAAGLAAGPPIALAQTKEMLHAGSGSSLREALEREAVAQVVNQGTDGPVAKQAFLDKTEPVFEGRWRL
jgi:enoyl-CoA hydratase/carnithine racemase